MQHDFILLDRSGSMSSLWEEALNSINVYVKELGDSKVDTGVTVMTFDDDKFEVIRERITPQSFRPLSDSDATPRGMTPLSDAVGRIVHLAEAGNYDKVSILIMTDGHENASKEYSVAQAKAALDRCRKKDWQVTFMGANFQNDSQAHEYGSLKSSSVYTSSRGLGDTMKKFAGMRSSYGISGQSIQWSDEDKAEAASK